MAVVSPAPHTRLEAPASTPPIRWALLFLLLNLLAAIIYLRLARPSLLRFDLSQHAAAPAAPPCVDLPPVAAVAAHWATALEWVRAPSSAEDGQLFPPERAVTVPLGDGMRAREGCGTAQEREAILSLRWRHPAPPPEGLPSYLTWDRSATCAALGGRAVLLLGDSLGLQFFDTLVSALQPLDAEPADRASPPAGLVCGGEGEAPSRVAFVSMDPPWEQRLRQALEDASDLEGGGQGVIFILNRGTWYLPLQSHLKAVQGMLAFVRSLAPNATIFWRTASAGHPEVYGSESVQNAPPLLHPPPPAAYAQGLPARYHWAEILAQNEPTVAALPPDVLVVDVAPAAALRHDSHPSRTYAIDSEKRDGVHYCLPGPVDQWVELWAAVLRYAAATQACA